MKITEHTDDDLIKEIKRRKIKIKIIDWYPFMPYEPSEIQIGNVMFDI